MQGNESQICKASLKSHCSKSYELHFSSKYPFENTIKKKAALLLLLIAIKDTEIKVGKKKKEESGQINDLFTELPNKESSTEYTVSPIPEKN